MKRTLAMTASTAIAMTGSMFVAAPATAAPNTNNQSGGAAGLVAAVVQANVQDVEVNVVRTGDINVALDNVLNNNRILTDFLNQNDVDITLVDVVDVNIIDNVLVIDVL